MCTKFELETPLLLRVRDAVLNYPASRITPRPELPHLTYFKSSIKVIVVVALVVLGNLNLNPATDSS